MKSLTVTFSLAVLSFSLSLLAGCSTTSVTSTWKNAGLTEPMHFNKIVALAIHEDGTIRRVAEDEMARQIGDRGVPAYTILTEEDRKDVQRVKARLQASGVDGAVTMEVLGKQSETTYSAGAVGRGSADFSFPSVDRADVRSNWAGSHSEMPVNDPQTNTILLIDTRIYSVNDGKMIWSATSHTETFTPENVREIVSEVAQAVRAELQKQNLIAAAEKK